MTYLLKILTLLFSKIFVDVIVVTQLLVKIHIKLRSGFCPINTTAHEVSQRARCNDCGVKGNNTYQIISRSNSDVALDGAAVRANTTTVV